MDEHKHIFHALWWNFGPLGPHDVHMHPCYDGRCKAELQGVGHDCNGQGLHRQVRYEEGSNEWLSNEGGDDE
jgi:hypothetical protein